MFSDVQFKNLRSKIKSFSFNQTELHPKTIHQIQILIWIAIIEQKTKIIELKLKIYKQRRLNINTKILSYQILNTYCIVCLANKKIIAIFENQNEY